MLGTAIIVFREVLEAALIIGIIAAATRDVPGRSAWILGGVVAGLLGAVVLAASADWLAGLADGLGQDIFNAAVLGVAVLMLAWHNIWMSRHGAELSKQARAVGRSITEGSQECSILLLVVGLAVLREGAETVLFLYGVTLSGGGGAPAMLFGGLLGTLGGVAVGRLLYAGLLRIPLRWFFAATATLVLLLAAGMAAQAARHLVQADLLPSLANPVWDLSAWLPNDSVPGLVLKAFLGYEARPSGMQLLFYLVALLLIACGMKLSQVKSITSNVQAS